MTSTLSIRRYTGAMAWANKSSRLYHITGSLAELSSVAIAKTKVLHEQDLAMGYGTVKLPHALERKYPNANRQWLWQFAFRLGNVPLIHVQRL
jgi:hypothetical protein